MPNLKRYLLASGTLAAVLIASSTMAASASSPLKITNCFRASTRPSTVTLTCADGNTVLNKLRWSSFGGLSAQATGLFETNTCNPNCAQGKVVKYQVAVKATDPRTCKGGLRVYNELTLQFTTRNPPSVGRLRRWTPGCPI